MPPNYIWGNRQRQGSWMRRRFISTGVQVLFVRPLCDPQRREKTRNWYGYMQDWYINSSYNHHPWWSLSGEAQSDMNCKRSRQIPKSYCINLHTRDKADQGRDLRTTRRGRGVDCNTLGSKYLRQKQTPKHKNTKTQQSCRPTTSHHNHVLSSTTPLSHWILRDCRKPPRSLLTNCVWNAFEQEAAFQRNKAWRLQSVLVDEFKMIRLWVGGGGDCTGYRSLLGEEVVRCKGKQEGEAHKDWQGQWTPSSTTTRG